MKEKLYTIPVNEAFDYAGECGFCALHKKLEREILDYVMGPSYMEEDIREDMDRMGFCQDHYRQMFSAGNRLGVALMLKSHMHHTLEETEHLFQEELSLASQKKKPFAKATDSPFEVFENAREESCYACFRMKRRMDSYFSTFFHLWKTEQEFRDKVLSGKGFCLSHLKEAMTEAKKRLNQKDYQAFLTAILPLQQENLRRVESDLDWFIQKFDYRFKEEPWKGSKDAVERGIQKMASLLLGEKD